MKKLKTVYAYTKPICVLTANAIDGMKEQYLQAGFDDYLSKPISKKEMNRVMEKFLH